MPFSIIVKKLILTTLISQLSVSAFFFHEPSKSKFWKRKENFEKFILPQIWAFVMSCITLVTYRWKAFEVGIQQFLKRCAHLKWLPLAVISNSLTNATDAHLCDDSSELVMRNCVLYGQDSIIKPPPHSAGPLVSISAINMFWLVSKN